MNKAVIRLTEALDGAAYSCAQRMVLFMDQERKRVSANSGEDDSPTAKLKNESARQRWDMFHRAIAHAKKSADEAIPDSEEQSVAHPTSGPFLTVVR